MYVEKRVAWPHVVILGGASCQCISYDQLGVRQFVQGFSKNILDETDPKIYEKMLQYLSELMEDVTDFAWASAKAAHEVLLCELERGSLDWTQTHRIDRIRRGTGIADCIRMAPVRINETTRMGGKCTSTYVPIV